MRTARAVPGVDPLRKRPPAMARGASDGGPRPASGGVTRVASGRTRPPPDGVTRGESATDSTPITRAVLCPPQLAERRRRLMRDRA